jgi:hypothetical protein
MKLALRLSLRPNAPAHLTDDLIIYIRTSMVLKLSYINSICFNSLFPSKYITFRLYEGFECLETNIIP